MSTLAKILLVGGGLLVAVVIAMTVWSAAWFKREMQSYVPVPPPPAPTSPEEQALVEFEVVRVESSRAALERAEVEATVEAEVAALEAALDAAVEAASAEMEAQTAELVAATVEAEAQAHRGAASKMSAAIATAITGLLDSDNIKVVSRDAPGLSFEVEGLEGVTLSTHLTALSETLVNVERGEMGFADVTQEESRAGERRPDWVPIPSWAREHPDATFRMSRKDADGNGFAFGLEAFVAETSAQEILDWYHARADRLESSQRVYRVRGSRKVDATSESEGKVSIRFLRSVRGSQSERMPPRGDIARFGIQWDDLKRKVTVFLTEDDHGDSLFVVLYKG